MKVFKQKEIGIWEWMNRNWKNFLKWHVQRSFWKGNNVNALCWAFYCVNGNKVVNVIAPQTMHCYLCHSKPILNLNPKTQARKRLIIYNTINGIAALRKHVNAYHSNVLKKLKNKWIVFWRKRKKTFQKVIKTFILTPYLVSFLQENFSRKRMCKK